MRPLRLLLLCVLLAPGRGSVPSVQEEFFTRPGSDLILPITIPLTLIPTAGRSCDKFDWLYTNSTNTFIISKVSLSCKMTKAEYVPNVRISENGSLIISNVTPQHDGNYTMSITDSTGKTMQKYNYIIHVEDPVSVPVLNFSCLRNGSAEISCRVEEGTNPKIHLSVIGGSQGNHSASANNITAIAGLPGPWNLTCAVKNGVSQSESRAGVTCPAPLSGIAMKSSCLPDGSAEAECWVNGSDPRYSWHLNGRVVSSLSRVILPPPVSGTLRCDVTNQFNTISEKINVFCAVPVSVPVLDVTCLQNGSAEISCRVEKGTNFSIYLTLNGEYNVISSERTVRVIVPPVSPPNSWNVSCWVKNNISRSSINKKHDSCQERSWSGWGHLLSHGAVCVLYTGLLICLAKDLRKMKDEVTPRKMKDEVTPGRRYRTQMEMEHVYYNEGH